MAYEWSVFFLCMEFIMWLMNEFEEIVNEVELIWIEVKNYLKSEILNKKWIFNKKNIFSFISRGLKIIRRGFYNIFNS